MPELDFKIEGAEVGEVFSVSSDCVQAAGDQLRSVGDHPLRSRLRCQIQIEVTRRRYTAEEQRSCAISLASPIAGARRFAIFSGLM